MCADTYYNVFVASLPYQSGVNILQFNHDRSARQQTVQTYRLNAESR